MVYQRPLHSDELMHYGVKGMKWHKHLGTTKRMYEDVNSRFSNSADKENVKKNIATVLSKTPSAFGKLVVHAKGPGDEEKSKKEDLWKEEFTKDIDNLPVVRDGKRFVELMWGKKKK